MLFREAAAAAGTGVPGGGGPRASREAIRARAAAARRSAADALRKGLDKNKAYELRKRAADQKMVGVAASGVGGEGV